MSEKKERRGRRSLAGPDRIGRVCQWELRRHTFREVTILIGWAFGFGWLGFEPPSMKCVTNAGQNLIEPESLILAQNERWRQA